MSEPIPEWATDFDSWMRRLAAARIEDREEPKFWDEAKVDQVLSKINRRHWREPFDRIGLANDLEAAKRLYDNWRGAFDLRPTSKKITKRAEQIRSLCARLLAVLPNPGNLIPKTDDVIPDAFGQLMFKGAEKVELLRSAITSLEEVKKLATQLTSLSEIPREDHGPNTANDWLIGKELPKIYGRYFTGKPQGVSTPRGRQNPSGPALEFLLIVLKIMQVRHSRRKHYQPYGIVEIWARAKNWSDMGFLEKK
jgi:hypothetical protein